MITAITVPANPAARRSHYLKVRDRASFEFAVVSAAVALDMDGARIRQARVALGGVGTKPWRVPQVEAALAGASLDPAALRTRGSARRRGRAGTRRTTTSRSSSCSAPSCVPSKSRELAHDHRIHRTTRQPRRRPPEGHRAARPTPPSSTVPGQALWRRSCGARSRTAASPRSTARRPKRAPGVIAVLTHRNAPRLAYRPHKGVVDPEVGERLHVLQDDRVNHQGQPIALVIADTLEQAMHAATLVRRHLRRRNRRSPTSPASSRSGRPQQKTDQGERRPLGDTARRSRRSARRPPR